MTDSVQIELSVSTPTAAEGRAVVEAGIARLKAAGLEVEWGRVMEDQPSRGALGGFEGGAHVYGKLRLYDTPETVAEKAKAARSIIDRFEYP